jgi:hypothetical protein
MGAGIQQADMYVMIALQNEDLMKITHLRALHSLKKLQDL